MGTWWDPCIPPIHTMVERTRSGQVKKMNVELTTWVDGGCYGDEMVISDVGGVKCGRGV